jgi:hypothetical protein
VEKSLLISRAVKKFPRARKTKVGVKRVLAAPAIKFSAAQRTNATLRE